MEIKPKIETFAKIKVVGVGGGGVAAVNRMVESDIRGIEFLAVNTDAQSLHYCNANQKIHIGKTLTHGLGAGMNPEIGRQAAEEDKEEIAQALKGADMVFITCGLGGGTGSGGAPVIADIAKRGGALTVGVITKPFTFEGIQRKQIAETALGSFIEKVDTLIIIPNDRLLQIIDKKTSLLDAFSVVDDVLRQGVQGISDLITINGVVNVDFADVRTVMRDTGSALMGIGRASGEDRAQEAAKAAIDSPLLELSIDGAKGILFNITGGDELGMYEIDAAAQVITESADPNAKIIFGAVIDKNMGEEIKITVIATGFDESKIRRSTALTLEEGTERRMTQEETIEEIAEGEKKDVKVGPQITMERFTVPQSDEDSEEGEKDKDKDDDLDIPAFIRRKMK